MKKGFIYFVVILALLVGVLVAIPGFLNWNEYKAEVTDTLYSQTGHRVNIDGNLVVRLLPSPALSAKGISLLDPDGQEFLSLDSLNVNVAFFALLAGRIEAHSIVLEGGSLVLRRDADGASNWDFLLPDDTASPTQSDDVRLDHVSVKHLNIEFKDAILGRDDQFEIVDATLKAESTKGPFQLSSAFAYGGESYEISFSSGRIVTARSFPLSLNIIVAEQTPGFDFQGTVVLDGAASAASGQFNGGGDSLDKVLAGLMMLKGGVGEGRQMFPLNLDKSFELSAPLVMTKARVTANPFAIAVGESGGEGSLLIAPKDEGVSTADVSLKLNNIKVENWLLDEQPTSDVAPATTANIDVSNTNVSNANVEVSYKLDVSLISYGDEVARRTSLSGKYTDGKLRIEQASSLLPGDTDLKVAGTITTSGNVPSFGGNIDLNSNNLRTVLSWLGQDLSAVPDDALKGFSLRTVMRVSESSFSLSDASGQLDGSQYSGDFTLQDFDNPSYKADMHLSSFDVDRYFPVDEDADDNPEEQSWQQITASIEQALSPLKGMQAELRLEAEKFKVRDARFEGLSINAQVAQNRLIINSLQVGDFRGLSGNIAGNIDGLGTTPRFNLNMDLASPSLAALTRWAGVNLPVDVYKLAAVSLKGHVDGTLEQVNVNLSGRGAHADYSVSGYLGGLTPAPEQIDLRISISGDDHQDFIRRMDIPLILQGEGMSFALAGGLKGAMDELNTDLVLDLIGGRVSLVGVANIEAEAPDFYIKIDANHARLINIADAFDLGFKQDNNLGGFQFKGIISTAENVYHLYAEQGVFGPSRYNFDLSYYTEDGQPWLSGLVSVDQLPISRFYGSSRTGAEAVQNAGGRRWQRQPFALDGLSKIDLDINFDAQEASYGNYVYVEPSFTVKLHQGVLDIENFRGNLFGGRTLATIKLDSRGIPKGRVVFSMEEASLEEALEASAAIKPATGSLSLRSDLEFSGASQFDAVSSLKGNVELWAQNGVINGVDIDRISRRLARLNRLPDFLSLLGSGLAGGETPYGNIRTNFEGERGVFSARQVVADIEGADVDARMRIDLPAWTMTGTGTMTLNEVELPAQTAQTREVVGADGQITTEEIPTPPVHEVPPIGVDIAGDIDNPIINYRTDRLRDFMGERFTSSLLENITGGGGIGGVLGLPTPTQPQQTPQQEQQQDQPVDPADVIVDTLFDIFSPRPEPEPQGEGEDEGDN